MSEETLREIAETLKEQLKWTRLAGLHQVKEILLAALDSDQKRIIYHLSNGQNGSVAIARLAGTSDRTVRRYWSLWGKIGIMESQKAGAGERFRKSFELEDVGIELPELSRSTELERKSISPEEVTPEA